MTSPTGGRHGYTASEAQADHGRARISRIAGIDGITILLAVAVVALLTIGGSGRAPSSDAAPPPPGRFAHGAAGTARNGFGGSVAPSPTIESWPGTGAGRNGGPFAFIGAQYGSLWSIPPGANNSMGIGYCVMEDVGGEGTVALQPDPATVGRRRDGPGRRVDDDIRRRPGRAVRDRRQRRLRRGDRRVAATITARWWRVHTAASGGGQLRGEDVPRGRQPERCGRWSQARP